MVQIIEERRSPSTGERLAGGASNIAQAFAQYMGTQKQKELQAQEKMKIGQQLSDITGMNLTALPESFQQEAFKQFLTGQREEEGKLRKAQEEVAPLQSALETVDRMRSIRKKGNLGIPSKFSKYFDETVRKDRGEYEQLGKSLIQYATNIPIRNRLEFETLADKLYDPNITDAEAKGVLDAMERIIKSSLSQYGQKDVIKEKSIRRPPLKSFAR